MSGLDVASGVMKITYGARTVLNTGGRLVSLLPLSANGYSVTGLTLSYPDVAKDWFYNWRWYRDPVSHTEANSGASWASAVPQEWSNTTNLMAAPAGCNMVAAKVRLNRTTAPTTTWFGTSVGVKVPENKWIPLSGSLLLEAENGMARAMSLYVAGGNLVLHQQQSVGPAAGGSVSVAAWAGGSGDTSSAYGGGSQGGEWLHGTTAGMPIYFYRSASTTFGSSVDRRYGGANAVPTPTSGTTNYASVYSLDIVARFGRADT